MIRLLAYQYRDLFDTRYDPGECQKFKRFLKLRLGLDLDHEILQGTDKVIRFSYPDLEYYEVPCELLSVLQQEFGTSISGATLNAVYVVYVREEAPQIGFTVSVAFDIVLADSNQNELNDRFKTQHSKPSKFHREFKHAWEKFGDKRRTLPVVIFANQIAKTCFFVRDRSFGDRLFGATEKVFLPSGRSVLLERGFPYVSYVLHGELQAAVPEDIHKCDFAILMALPGFVENKLESIREYRKKLRTVQKNLEDNDVGQAERLYSEAWHDFEAVQGLMPTTTAAVQRIKQKYPGKSVFATIADDNTELIESTVNAAIKATEQVRANIQAFAQRRLQRSVNWLQGLTAVLTGILVLASAITAYVAFKGTTKTEITSVVQPIRVSSETIPDGSVGPKTTVKLTPLFEGTYPPSKELHLRFARKSRDATAILSTPMALAGSSPIQLFVLAEDGAVLAEGSLAIVNPPAAVEFNVPRHLFAPDRKYRVQIEQDPTWKLRLPIILSSAP